MLTGFLRNNTDKPITVKLVGTEDSVLEFHDLEGNSVVLNGESAIANLGKKLYPVEPVVDLSGNIIIT